MHNRVMISFHEFKIYFNILNATKMAQMFQKQVLEDTRRKLDVILDKKIA